MQREWGRESGGVIPRGLADINCINAERRYPQAVWAAAIIAYFAALIFNLKLLSDIGAAETLLIDKLQCNLRLNADIQRE